MAVAMTIASTRLPCLALLVGHGPTSIVRPPVTVAFPAGTSVPASVTRLVTRPVAWATPRPTISTASEGPSLAALGLAFPATETTAVALPVAEEPAVASLRCPVGPILTVEAKLTGPSCPALTSAVPKPSAALPDAEDAWTLVVVATYGPYTPCPWTTDAIRATARLATYALPALPTQALRGRRLLQGVTTLGASTSPTDLLYRYFLYGSPRPSKLRSL